MHLIKFDEESWIGTNVVIEYIQTWDLKINFYDYKYVIVLYMQKFKESFFIIIDVFYDL